MNVSQQTVEQSSSSIQQTEVTAPTPLLERATCAPKGPRSRKRKIIADKSENVLESMEIYFTKKAPTHEEDAHNIFGKNVQLLSFNTL